MAKKSHHVIPNPNGGWSVKKEAATRASKHFDRKADAIAWAKNVSKKEGAELIVHGADGTIVSMDSYGADRRPPQGRSNE